MNLANHETKVNDAPSPLLLSAAKKEKKFLSIPELIAKVKEFTIEVYGDDVHDIIVEEIRDHQRSYGTHIQISFQLVDRRLTSTNAGNEITYEKRGKEFTLDPKTGFIESMRNITKNHAANPVRWNG